MPQESRLFKIGTAVALIAGLGMIGRDCFTLIDTAQVADAITQAVHDHPVTSGYVPIPVRLIEGNYALRIVGEYNADTVTRKGKKTQQTWVQADIYTVKTGPDGAPILTKTGDKNGYSVLVQRPAP